MKRKIFIVLATHNGGLYLEDQIQSLIEQTEKNWTLIISDDSSVDNTAEIISSYLKVESRVRFIEARLGLTSSSINNFVRCQTEAYRLGAEYVFFCDQDDIWDPEKLAITLRLLQQAEGDSRIPCLVHHDLIVVNSQLQILNPSFWDLICLKPRNETKPQRLLSRNEVTGCAMACNRALLEIALPIPSEAIMHDWWLALCAGFFGRLRFIPDKLVKYRQHDANVIGAKSFWHGLNPLSSWAKGWQAGNSEFMATVEQARAFRTTFEHRLDLDSKYMNVLDSYCALPILSRLQRLKALKTCDVWRGQWLLDTVLVLRMLFLARESD